MRDLVWGYGRVPEPVPPGQQRATQAGTSGLGLQGQQKSADAGVDDDFSPISYLWFLCSEGNSEAFQRL